MLDILERLECQVEKVAAATRRIEYLETSQSFKECVERLLRLTLEVVRLRPDASELLLVGLRLGRNLLRRNAQVITLLEQLSDPLRDLCPFVQERPLHHGLDDAHDRGWICVV